MVGVEGHHHKLRPEQHSRLSQQILACVSCAVVFVGLSVKHQLVVASTMFASHTMQQPGVRSHGRCVCHVSHMHASVEMLLRRLVCRRAAAPRMVACSEIDWHD